MLNDIFNCDIDTVMSNSEIPAFISLENIRISWVSMQWAGNNFRGYQVEFWSLLEDPIIVKSITAIEVLFLFFSLRLSVKLDSLSC